MINTLIELQNRIRNRIFEWEESHVFYTSDIVQGLQEASDIIDDMLKELKKYER
jgi:hypothetical protein